MASTQAGLSPHLLASLLAAAIAAGAPAPASASSVMAPAAAVAGVNGSSVVRLGPEETARRSLSVVEAAPPPARRDPASCAAAFHARFAGILAGPYADLKAAMGAGAPGPEGAAAAGLPGELIFAPAARPRTTAETAALRNAAALARRAGRAAPPADANARWVAARIREDLADFLTQKPTSFLCGGIDAYLATLKRLAGGISMTADRRTADVGTQTRAALRSVEAALQALKPVPIPVPAPADRPDPGVVSQTLRSTVGLGDAETMGPPMLMAHRGGGATRISDSGGDPDLPPLARRPERGLDGEAEILAAIDDLTRAMGDPAPPASAEPANLPAAALPTDGLVTGSIAGAVGAGGARRPVLARLAALRPRLVGPNAAIRDPGLRMALVGAFADLEALDYLRAALDEPADPLSAAMNATFEAIARAHRESR